MIHSSILWKSKQFTAYIWKLCFWALGNRHAYQGSDVDWPFRRENSNIRSWILDKSASLRIHGFSWKSIDFARYIRQLSKKVTISLRTFKNSALGISEFDTPIEDQKWSGRFVERIWGSDRGSSMGGRRVNALDSTYTLTHHPCLSAIEMDPGMR